MQGVFSYNMNDDLTQSMGQLQSAVAQVANVANSSFTFGKTKQLMDKQFEQQMELTEYANDWTEEMWNKANDYNSPSAQVQRMRDAGLNPSMLFGKTTDATTPTSATGQTALGSTPAPADWSPTANMGMNMYQSAVQREAIGVEQQKLDIQKQKLASEINLNDSIANLNIKNVDLTDEKINEVKQNIANMKQTVLEMQANIDLLRERAITESKGREQKDRELGIYERQNEIQLYNARTNRMNAFTEQFNADTHRLAQQAAAKVADSQIGLNKRQANLLLLNAFESYARTKVINQQYAFGGTLYNLEIELKKGQIRLNDIKELREKNQYEIEDATKQVEIFNSYIGAVDNVFSTFNNAVKGVKNANNSLNVMKTYSK